MSVLRDLLSMLLPETALAQLLHLGIVSVLTVLATLLASRALERFLAARRQISAGPVFFFAALSTLALHGLLALVLVFRGESLEAALASWLVSKAGLGAEAARAVPASSVVLLVSFGSLGFYLGLSWLLAWAFGLLGEQRGAGVMGELEEELGTQLAPAWYRLVGYVLPEGPEARFVEWAKPLSRILLGAVAIALPFAMSAAMPAATFAAGFVLADAFAKLVARPPAARAEPAEEAVPVAAEAQSLRDPDQLLRALQIDPRGPQLAITRHAPLVGRPGHLADETRIAESPVVREAMTALGIDELYVHQEAASEALLGGRDVLMEAPPLSGRRTLGDLLAIRSVLIDGGTVLYLSPSKEECARRFEAFGRFAQRSSWRWALEARDLANEGRRGLDPRVRQPSILFVTVEELHGDLCRLHSDWDHFLARLSLVVAVDLDRYTGARGANFAHGFARLGRLAKLAGGAPRVLSTMAPWGPDVQAFAERLLGRPLTVIGPESDSRAVPSQLVLVGDARVAAQVDPAVLSRGVAIACGYETEVWGYDDVLTELERDQQVNKVLLAFSKATVGLADPSHLRFDRARALVVRFAADSAAMIPFFTKHVGAAVLGGAMQRAQSVGAERRRDNRDGEMERAFEGFARVDEGAEEELAAASEAGVEGAGGAGSAGSAPSEGARSAALAALAEQLTAHPEWLPAVWIPEADAFSQLVAREPELVHPDSLHPMLEMGSRLVDGMGSETIAERHLLAAAREAPLERREALRRAPAELVARLLAPRSGEPVLEARARYQVDADGAVERVEDLVLRGEVLGLESMVTTSAQRGTVVNRAGGELVLELDRERLLVTAYPGRVFTRSARRYRVLEVSEQDRLGEGVVWVEPERRRLFTERMRSVKIEASAEGHELSLGGARSLRFSECAVELEETVLGLRTRRRGQARGEVLRYDTPLVARYETRAAIIVLGDASGRALAALERMLGVCLPAFLRHEEDDVDVVGFAEHATYGSMLAVVDRHVGGAGYSRALSSEVLRHALYWAARIVRACGKSAACVAADGCEACVFGGADRSAPGAPAPSRAELESLLEQLLGEAH